MAKFTEPANAVRNFVDLKDDDVLWEVNGTYPPSMSEKPVVVVGSAVKFKDHREFRSHSSQGELYVFDCAHHWHETGQSMLHFATDANMTPGYSHNDNYMFRSESEASDFLGMLRSEWEARPDLIAEVLADRVLMNNLWDDFAYDDFDYPENEDIAA